MSECESVINYGCILNICLLQKFHRIHQIQFHQLLEIYTENSDFYRKMSIYWKINEMGNLHPFVSQSNSIYSILLTDNLNVILYIRVHIGLLNQAKPLETMVVYTRHNQTEPILFLFILFVFPQRRK